MQLLNQNSRHNNHIQFSKNIAKDDNEDAHSIAVDDGS